MIISIRLSLLQLQNWNKNIRFDISLNKIIEIRVVVNVSLTFNSNNYSYNVIKC